MRALRFKTRPPSLHRNFRDLLLLLIGITLGIFSTFSVLISYSRTNGQFYSSSGQFASSSTPQYRSNSHSTGQSMLSSHLEQSWKLRHGSAPSVHKLDTLSEPSCETLCECLLLNHQESIPRSFPNEVNNYKRTTTKSLPSLWWEHIHPNLNHFQEWDVGTPNGEDVDDTLKEKYQDWLERLFRTLTPHRLQKAHKSSPSEASIRAIHDILERRYKDPTQNPPVQIAVLGGSVTAGHDYERNGIGLEIPNPHPTQAKAWPKRLETLLNKVLGFDAVHVTNLAVSATTSDIGALILEYHLFPSTDRSTSSEDRARGTGAKLDSNNSQNYFAGIEAQGPDVVVWSFATNDLASNIFTPVTRPQVIQNFITRAQQLRCSGSVKDPRPDAENSTTSRQNYFDLPMVVLVDDLVFQAHDIKRLMTFSSEIGMLAQWNEAMGVSIGAALLDVALGNPSESALHAEWLQAGDGEKGAMEGWKRQARIHPGLGIHISMAWIVTFQLFREALNFCQATMRQNNPWDNGADRNLVEAKPESLINKHHYTALGDTLPNAPLPPFHSKLDAREVLPLWKAGEKQHREDCASRNTGDARVRCSYAWVSNRLSFMGTKKQIQQWMDKILLESYNWTVEGYALAGDDSVDKVGWEASEIGASFVIEHKNEMMGQGQKRAIQMITVICMHSYGPKWKNSRVKMIIQKKHEKDASPTEVLATSELIGFHESRTSVYFPYRYFLKEDQAIEPGEILRMEFRLIDGTTFKILGLTFCAD